MNSSEKIAVLTLIVLFPLMIVAFPILAVQELMAKDHDRRLLRSLPARVAGPQELLGWIGALRTPSGVRRLLELLDREGRLEGRSDLLVALGDVALVIDRLEIRDHPFVRRAKLTVVHVRNRLPRWAGGTDGTEQKEAAWPEFAFPGTVAWLEHLGIKGQQRLVDLDHTYVDLIGQLIERYRPSPAMTPRSTDAGPADARVGRFPPWRA